MKLLALTLLLCLPGSASPGQASGGDFTLLRSVIAAGGGAASGGEFQLRGTVAQAVARPVASGGNFVLRAGFWTAGTDIPSSGPLFEDGFESPSPRISVGD